MHKFNREKKPKEDNRPERLYQLVNTETDEAIYEWTGKGLELHLDEFNEKIKDTGKPISYEEYQDNINKKYCWYVIKE